MKRGKLVCNTLKCVRKRIADANNISYEYKDCSYDGDCKGTCPACEEEVKYLETELLLRKNAGKTINIIGVAIGVGAMAISCNGSSHVTPTNGSNNIDSNTATVNSDTTKSGYVTIKGCLKYMNGGPVVSALIGTMKSGESVKTDSCGNFCVSIPYDSTLRVNFTGFKEKCYKISDLDTSGFNTLYLTENDKDIDATETQIIDDKAVMVGEIISFVEETVEGEMNKDTNKKREN